MRTLLLIRHGSTAGNLERRYIGRTDEPLCEQGRAQIEALAAQNLKADVVFASPAGRTRETAEMLFPGQAKTEEPGLWETDFGDFEARTGDELWENSEAYRIWVDGGCVGPVPGGETREAFKKRCCEAFLRCLKQVPEGKTAAFVIHGGSIMAILEQFARPKRDFYDYHIGNGDYLRCREENGILRL